MNDESFTLEQWRELYAAAEQFKQLECWRWMVDGDIFGVLNPEDGEIGYCCVLGNAGEFFGLAVYLGSYGLDFHRKIHSGQIAPGNPDNLFLQKCLTLSFDDRKDLDKRDLQLIKDLGFSFRGTNQWPRFRSHQPGYVPWYLTPAEARFMTLALQQTAVLAKRFRNEPGLLDPPAADRQLVRVPRPRGDGLEWREEWLRQEPPRKKNRPRPPKFDPARLRMIKAKASHRQGVWEYDFFLVPYPIDEGKRPYFPYLSMWVDQHSGYLFSLKFFAQAEYREGMHEQLLKIISQNRRLPREVRVKREEAFELLKPLAAELGFELTVMDSLPAVEEAKGAFLKHFGL